MNYLGIRDILSSAYQFIIEILNDKSEAEMFTSARSRITFVLEEMNQREIREQ